MWDSLNDERCNSCQYNSSIKMDCDQMDGPYLDKENLQPFNATKNDLSFYDNGTYNSSPFVCRRPLEEHDPNSRDSGYSASYHGEKFLSCGSPTRTATASFASMLSMEDEYLDFADVEPLEKPSLPQDFNKLITDPLIARTKSCNESGRPSYRRTLSLQLYTDKTPISRKVKTSLFKADSETRSFKRPEPPNDAEMFGIKRSRIYGDDDDDSDENTEAAVPVGRRPVIQRAFSATEESIMCAVQRSSTEPDLIGDFSKNFSLPLTTSRHPDLKAITPATLASLMKYEFQDTVSSFTVIDCRYPYEYEGGHIQNALNIYTKEQCLELLNSIQECPKNPQHRDVLIFHCEFSSERGPNLYRYLRKEDRNKNESEYPYLHYPEIYLLEGGYKKFYEQYSELCTPVGYKEMLHPDHEQDLKHFRQKSKTWNCDSRRQGRNTKRL